MIRQAFHRLSVAATQLAWWRRGTRYATRWPTSAGPSAAPPGGPGDKPSPLEAFFDARTEGPGVWKWRHYLDAYHRHLGPLRGRGDLVVLEIGVYSGGSLDLWRDYFGPTVCVYGVDIESACRAYERPGTRILIGDQADRSFWRRVIADGTLPPPDVVVDDGGHAPDQQRVTLEELLPHVRPGGVYATEDVHGRGNPFAAFVAGLADALNGVEGMRAGGPERAIAVPASGVQASLHSIHLYPFLTVIEKRSVALAELVAPKRGTRWEPFLG